MNRDNRTWIGSRLPLPEKRRFEPTAILAIVIITAVVLMLLSVRMACLKRGFSVVGFDQIVRAPSPKVVYLLMMRNHSSRNPRLSLCWFP